MALGNIGTVYEWSTGRLVYAVTHETEKELRIKKRLQDKLGNGEAVSSRQFFYYTGDPVLELLGAGPESAGRRLARLEASTLVLDKELGNILREMIEEMRRAAGLWKLTIPRIT